MPMRVCTICRAAENPIGRLRFKKYLDGKVYCENCIPASVEELDPTPPKRSPSPMESSAGSLVVIRCPDCRGGGCSNVVPGGAVCEACVGYGAVRIPANFLNVYRPKTNTPEPGGLSG